MQRVYISIKYGYNQNIFQLPHLLHLKVTNAYKEFQTYCIALSSLPPTSLTIIITINSRYGVSFLLIITFTMGRYDTLHA